MFPQPLDEPQQRMSLNNGRAPAPSDGALRTLDEPAGPPEKPPRAPRCASWTARANQPGCTWVAADCPLIVASNRRGRAQSPWTCLPQRHQTFLNPQTSPVPPDEPAATPDVPSWLGLLGTKADWSRPAPCPDPVWKESHVRDG